MNEYRNLVLVCAESGKAVAKEMAMAGIFEPLYLYYRKSEPGRSGALLLVRDSVPAPAGMKLATGEGLRGNVPYEAYFQWVFDRARSLPVLAF